MNFANDPSPPAAPAAPAAPGGDAASLTAIKLRRTDRSAPVAKAGDLTGKLRSAAPAASAAPVAPPLAAPTPSAAPTAVPAPSAPPQSPSPIASATPRMLVVTPQHSPSITITRNGTAPVAATPRPPQAVPARPATVGPQRTAPQIASAPISLQRTVTPEAVAARPAVPAPAPRPVTPQPGAARPVTAAPAPRPMTPPAVSAPRPMMPQTMSAPAPAPRQVPPAPSPARATPPTNVSPVQAAFQDERALRTLWEQLRGRDDVPLVRSLDLNRVAASWTNTLMVSFEGSATMPHVARLGRHTPDIEYTSMVTEWILAGARHTATLQRPIEREEHIPGEHRRRSYRMVLLPFASAPGRSDHILCHLTSLD